MICPIAGGALILIAALSTALPIRFAISASGQWTCGVNGINLVFCSGISTVITTLSLIGIRALLPVDKRFTLWCLACPWIVLAAIILWLMLLAPDCPFPSR